MMSSNKRTGIYFIYECKRLNKYDSYLKAYINEGMRRFFHGQYYPESSMNLAGMIAFVEVNLEDKPNGYLDVDQLADRLEQRIRNNESDLRTQRQLSSHQLSDEQHPEISGFKHCYLSKHLCGENNREVTIYHLLLDYYDLLVP